MNKSRRIGVVVAASAAAMGMTAVGMAAPASAGGHGDDYGQGPRPVSNWLRSVQANSSSWIAVNWRSSRRVCDVQVRITGGRNVDVDYSSNRRFGSLAHGGGSLWAQDDYSAIRVTPDYDRSGIALLRTTITYKNCGGGGGSVYGVGVARHRSYWLTLPVACTDNGRGNGHGGPVFHGGGNGHTGPIGNGHGQWDDNGPWNGHNGGGHGQWDDNGPWNGHNGGGSGHGDGGGSGHGNGGGSGHGDGGGSGHGNGNGGDYGTKKLVAKS